MKNNKPLYITLAVVGAFIVLVIAMFVFYFNQNNSSQDGRIPITNYSSYVKNLSSDERAAIEKALYSAVLMNGVDVEEIKTVKDATIRESSYDQTFDKNIYTTKFMVDIASIKQSYKIEDLYSTQSREESGLYDYTTLALCPNVKDLKYGDFSCKDRLSQEAGLEKSDPLIQYMPVSTLDYTLELDPNSKDIRIIAKLNLTEVDYKLGAQEAVDRYTQSIKEWFIKNNLDINKYPITYQY